MLIIISVTIIFSIIFAILGCLSLWKKYIYFSDGLSHASLLTLALSSLVGVSLTYAGMIVTVIFASLIFKLQQLSGRNEVANVIANIMLALALIIASINPMKINIMQLLFGDIISANIQDLYLLIALLTVVSSFIIIYYNSLILIVLNKETAQIYGIKVKQIEFQFLMILSFAVFLSIKIVGALLVNGILIIPAMTAKLLSYTPLQMIILSICISVITSGAGLATAFYLDMPIAPVIILSGTICYIGAFIKCSLMKNI